MKAADKKNNGSQLSRISRRKSSAEDPIVAIDIGTYKIRFIAGTVEKDNTVKVSYYKEIFSAGMVAGSIADLAALAGQITELVHSYQNDTGRTWNSCVLGICGRHIHSFNSHGNTTIMGETVSVADKRKAIENACTVHYAGNDQFLHGIPRDFTVNDVTGIINPVGLSTPRIDVSVHLITCSQDQDKNLRRLISTVSEQSRVERVVFNGIAAADAVLTESEKEIGVAVIDLGEGSVNVAVYDRKQLIISFGQPHCADQIRREMAQMFGVSMESAEYLKTNSWATPNVLDDDTKAGFYKVPNTNPSSYDNAYMVPVSAVDVAKIMEDNLTDIFRKVRDRIEEKVSQDNELSSLNLGAGFVLTGGLAQVRNIEAVASRALSMVQGGSVSVRVACPRGIETADEELRGEILRPDKAVAIGLLRYTGNEMNEMHALPEGGSNKKPGIFTWLRQWWGREF